MIGNTAWSLKAQCCLHKFAACFIINKHASVIESWKIVLRLDSPLVKLENRHNKVRRASDPIRSWQESFKFSGSVARRWGYLMNTKISCLPRLQAPFQFVGERPGLVKGGKQGARALMVRQRNATRVYQARDVEDENSRIPIQSLLQCTWTENPIYRTLYNCSQYNKR